MGSSVPNKGNRLARMILNRKHYGNDPQQRLLSAHTS